MCNIVYNSVVFRKLKINYYNATSVPQRSRLTYLDGHLCETPKLSLVNCTAGLLYIFTPVKMKGPNKDVQNQKNY